MSVEIALIVLSALISILTLAATAGNDVATSQGTAVGSGALSKRGAQIIAGFCEFAGAALVGHQVSNTIGSKMVGSDDITDLQYCWGMFSGLLSVGLWMIIATRIKMPVSATHSIIGALFGLNLVTTNFDWASIDWEILGKIAIAWVVTPLLSFGGSYFSLVVLNIYWPADNDRDNTGARGGSNNDSQTDILGGGNELDPSKNSSSILSFVMAPPNAKLTPIPTPSPKRLGHARLTWHAANKNEQENEMDMDDDEESDEEYIFTPAPMKFALVFGILMATLVIVILIGGPKSINLVEGEIEVEDWVIVVIAFGSLIVFIIVGYLIEPCYRKLYIKCVYNKDINTTTNDIDNDTDYASVELAQKSRNSQATIIDAPAPTPMENKSRKSTSNIVQDTNISIDMTDQKYSAIDNGAGDDKKRVEKAHDNSNDFDNQDYFRLYLIFASGAVAFAHGGNDVANVLGPFGQIYKYGTTGSIEGDVEIPIYVAAGAGLCIAIGFALFGAPVLETIGKSITRLSYRSGFAAQFCAAATVLACNVLGLPVSTSTTIVGAISGVGLYNSKHNKKNKKEKEDNKKYKDGDDVEYVGCINKMKYLWQQKTIRILCKILAIWIITIPVNAVICGATYAFINVFL